MSDTFSRQSDEVLVQLVVAGCNRAREALFERVRGRLERQFARFAANRLDPSIDVDDLVQDVQIAVFRAVDRFDPTIGSFKSLVQRIASNKKYDVLRRFYRGPPPGPLPPEVTAGGDRELDVDAAAIAWRGVSRLPRPQRQAIRLHLGIGLTIAEAALCVDCHPDALRQRIKRGLATLSKRLARLGRDFASDRSRPDE